MSQASCDRDLDRTVANFHPLALERAVAVFPDRLSTAGGKAQKFALREQAKQLRHSAD